MREHLTAGSAALAPTMQEVGSLSGTLAHKAGRARHTGYGGRDGSTRAAVVVWYRFLKSLDGGTPVFGPVMVWYGLSVPVMVWYRLSGPVMVWYRLLPGGRICSASADQTLRIWRLEKSVNPLTLEETTEVFCDNVLHFYPIIQY